jgi:predicted esterase
MSTLPENVFTSGADLDRATGAVVLLHGRGAAGPGILSLAEAIGFDESTWAALAPQAPAELGGSWYPHRFTAELEHNEPWLSRALGQVAQTVAAIEAAGIPSERVVLGGFSQGACLAAEFALRHARRWGAVLVFSGGLIGPPGTRWTSAESLGGTPVLLAGSDNDAHIPLVRVEESARALSDAGAHVETDLYRGAWHTIVPDEIRSAQQMITHAGLH